MTGICIAGGHFARSRTGIAAAAFIALAISLGNWQARRAEEKLELAAASTKGEGPGAFGVFGAARRLGPGAPARQRARPFRRARRAPPRQQVLHGAAAITC